MSKANRLLKNLGRLRLPGRSPYHKEKKILAGRSVACRNDRRSILFGTIHKAASVYVWEVLKKVAKLQKLNSINFDGYYYRNGQLDHQLSVDHFQRRGFMYGPFRKGVGHIVDAEGNNTLDFDDYKIIVQLRDPRDALTSSYYSFLHSHCVLPKDRKRIEAVRNRMDGLDIDRHVIGQSGFLVNLLREYSTFFSQPNCLVLHYEDFVQHPEAWSKKITNFLDLKGNAAVERIFRKMVTETRTRPSTENINLHKRKVTPGEYATKLKPRTIKILNDRFADYFEALDAQPAAASKFAA